ncbi:hypothetical protein [Halocola ammonii]
MDKDWMKIYSDALEHTVMLVKLKLEENNIPTIILNKRDSSYNAFGEVELYIRREDSVKARHLINDNFEE